jgi:hypothetical protein
MSAPGPSGLRMNHLREALDTSSSDRNAWLETLKDWLSTSASGLLPAWCAPDLCAARLVPLQKKQGGNRPVAVGETPYVTSPDAAPLLTALRPVCTVPARRGYAGSN